MINSCSELLPERHPKLAGADSDANLQPVRHQAVGAYSTCQ